MARMIALLVAISCIVFSNACDVAHGGNPHGGCMTIPEMTDHLWALADTDKDQLLSLTELQSEFIVAYDDNGSGCVSSEEFVRHWMQKYQDTEVAANQVFSVFDEDSNSSLCNSDIGTLLSQADFDGDHKLDKYEYDNILLFGYSENLKPTTDGDSFIMTAEYK